MKHRAFFFDRDGVVNPSPPQGYVTSPAEFSLMPGVAELLGWLKARGFLLVLVTNQQGVAKGLMTGADLAAVHEKMQSLLGSAAFDDIQACTHLDGSCTCRKPSPEMVRLAATKLKINLAQSWLVGDHDRDIEMGRAAGVGKCVRFVSEKKIGKAADYTVTDHAELLALVRRELGDRGRGPT